MLSNHLHRTKSTPALAAAALTAAAAVAFTGIAASPAVEPASAHPGTTYAAAGGYKTNPVFIVKGTGAEHSAALSWKKVAGATKYEVWAARCDGHAKYTKVKTLKGSKTRYTDTCHRSWDACKYFVVAKKGRKVVAQSPAIHVAFLENRSTNAKKVTLKSAKSVKKVRSSKFTVKAKAVKASKRKGYLGHTKKEIRYYSSDTKVATVGLYTGKVTLKKPGKAKIFAIAENGAKAVTKVTSRKWPKPTFALTNLAYAHVGVATSLDVFNKENVESVSWEVAKWVDGEKVPVDAATAIDGVLADGANSISFKEAGTYTLTATATSSHGKTSSDSRTVVVTAQPNVTLTMQQVTDEHVAVPVTLATDGAGTVRWAIADKDGNPVDWTVAGAKATGELTATGGTLTFDKAGLYTVTAYYHDDCGQAHASARTIEVNAVGTFGIFAADSTHTDTAVNVTCQRPDDSGASTWTLTKDGVPVDLTDTDKVLYAGLLTDNGGTLQFLEKGTWVVSCTFTNPAGTVETYSKTIVVYPVVDMEFTLPDHAWTDTHIDVVSVNRNLEGLTAVWTLERNDTAVEWANVADGSLSNDGGSFTFLQPGTYRLVAHVTDATGRVFTFDSGRTCKVLPAQGITFDLPDTAKANVAFSLDIDIYEPLQTSTWSLTRDGHDVSISEHIAVTNNDSLGNGSRTVSFTYPGVYVLTGTYTDTEGRVHTWSDTIDVR